VNCINYWNYHKIDSILYFCMTNYFLFSCYKVMTIVRYSDRLWGCLSVTQFDLTSYGDRYSYIMKNCRKWSILYTSASAFVSITALICYIICPLFFNEMYISMTNFNGSTGTYRLNLFNFYSFIPDEIYNGYFWIIYVVETIFAITVAIFLNISDIYFISVCMALSGQLQTISTEFSSIGKDDFQHLHVSNSASKYSWYRLKHLLLMNVLDHIRSCSEFFFVLNPACNV